MDPNDIIDAIVDAIDYAELARDPQGLTKARRLLNNDLRQAIDQYVQVELYKASETSGADGEFIYELFEAEPSPNIGD